MKREIKFDILKVIGLLCIILAHVEAPSFLSNIRTFDVTLMILMSAYLGIVTYRKNSAISYLVKRFNRLVLPTWIFITLFFIITYVISLISNTYFFGIKEIVGTYALSSHSIGYVWVVRIYFIIALLVLAYKKAMQHHVSEKHMLYTSILLFFIYEVACHYGLFNNFYIQYLFAYFIPCFFLLCLSRYIFNNKKKSTIIIGIFSLIAFIASGYILYKSTSKIQPIWTMKYPFRTYYLSYGILITVILTFIANNKLIQKVFDNKITSFISSHSLWIYLWHILFIYALKPINMEWYLRYSLLISLSFTITYLQSIIVAKIEKKHNYKILKVFKG